MIRQKSEKTRNKRISPISIGGFRHTPSPTEIEIEERIAGLVNACNDRERQQVDMAHKLASAQLRFAKATKEWLDSIKKVRSEMQKLSDIERECLAVSDLSPHALEDEIVNFSTKIAAQERENSQIKVVIKKTKKSMTKRIELEIDEREKALIQVFNREWSEIKKDRAAVKKQLDEELNITMQLLSLETTLKTQIAEMEVKRVETRKKLQHASAVGDQKISLEICVDAEDTDLLMDLQPDSQSDIKASSRAAFFQSESSIITSDEGKKHLLTPGGGIACSV